MEGWDKWQDSGKTQSWRTKFYDAHCIAFDGRDSPNFDYPEDKKAKFPYLIGPKKLKAVAETLGNDSPLWWNQCVGKPRPGMEALKVITKRICEDNNAFEEVIWEGTGTVQICSLDAAYGGVGGDRCVLMRHEFGRDIEKKLIFRPHSPVLVPVKASAVDPPDRQIVRFCMNYCQGFGIPPENFFFDGRSTLMAMFAQMWSGLVNPVDFGGQPTDRPVSLDEYVWDGEKKSRRLKKCSEHYSKFVTELWFAAYYIIISGQMRNLDRQVAEEGCKRIYTHTAGNRIEVEPKMGRTDSTGRKRPGMKDRTSQSPDMFDCLVTGIEGARRRGFDISKLAVEDENSEPNWFQSAAADHKRGKESHSLTYQ